MNNRPPTDDEIRKRYGPDVEIRHSLPNPTEIAEKHSLLMQVAGSLGFEVWMWKSLAGAILGVIIVVPGVAGIYDYWIPKIKTSYEYALPYIAMLRKAPQRLSDDLVLFSDNSSSKKSGINWPDRPIEFIVPSTIIDSVRNVSSEVLSARPQGAPPNTFLVEHYGG